MQTNEEWRPIPGWATSYEASSLGRIRSVDRIDTNGCRRDGKILKPLKSNNGLYEAVSLTQGRYRHRIQIHRLVLFAFCGIPLIEDAEARHLNGDGRDNQRDNLEWGTAKDNAADRERHGHTVKGSKHHLARLTEKDVRTIRTLYRPHAQPSMRVLATQFCVSRRAIQKILNCENWRHIKC